jgi:hypothetical protein
MYHFPLSVGFGEDVGGGVVAVGARVGDVEGFEVTGERLSDMLGRAVGLLIGEELGPTVGCCVVEVVGGGVIANGAWVGDVEGFEVTEERLGDVLGRAVGLEVVGGGVIANGAWVGDVVIAEVGFAEEELLGCVVDPVDGCAVIGEKLGILLGLALDESELGFADGEAWFAIVGLDVG